MILSERELELGADHSGIMVLADGPGARHAARRRASARRDGARDRDGLQPPGPDVRVRDRTRGRGADGRGADAAARTRSGARGRRARGRARRGSRGLPALHRPDLPRRRGGAEPDLAEGAPARSGDAADLEHRRRHQLRDARARLAAARLRPVAARGRPDRRPSRPGGGEDPHPRRPRAHADRDRPRDRGRAAAGRRRRDHGREDSEVRDETSTCCSRRRTSTR